MSEKANLEDSFQNIFKSSSSGTGEEELLRIATDFSSQLTSKQIKAILFLEMIAYNADTETQAILVRFVDRWLRLKRNNNSDLFVMKALEHISLRKFMTENSMKVDVSK